MVAASPYQTALALGRPKPNFTPNPDDADRVTAYWTYSDIFRNDAEGFGDLLRPEDDVLSRRYVAQGRALVEATNRYLAKGLGWTFTVPADVTASDEVVGQVRTTLDALFKREEFNAKFAAMKRWMLVRGDALLHISADPTKPEGTRLRITELLPETYFPLTDPIDAERVVGCYIVNIVDAVPGETEQIAMRVMYRRILSEDDAATFGSPIGTVVTQTTFWEKDGWDDRAPLAEEDLKPVETPERYASNPMMEPLLTGVALPPSITAVPVYHYRNNREGSALFGVSELQGIETMLAGLTQNLGDEDLTVALQGVGFYATDSGHPTDAQGNEVPWVVAPGSIVELEDGKKIERIEGATNVETSFGAHMNRMKLEAQQATGTPDVAVGKVDVQVVQSGIALAVQMAPMTSKTEEKELELKSKTDQLVFDLLNGWLPAYESATATGVVVEVTFDDPLPTNRKEVLAEVIEMVTAKIIDTEFAREILRTRLGYDFPPGMLAAVASEQQALLDATGARLDAEAAGGAGPPAEPV